MSPRSSPFDVFFSHSLVDTFVADSVNQRFQDAGVRVFATRDMNPENRYNDESRSILRECVAFVILLTPPRLLSQEVPFELGAALIRRTPLYLLLDGLEPDELPAFLSRQLAFPLARLSEVIQAIVALKKAFTDEQRQALKSVYQHAFYNVDQLSKDTGAADELAREWEVATGQSITPDALVRELLRMRKRGELPRRRPAKTTLS
jgi:hypothetical protein